MDDTRRNSESAAHAPLQARIAGVALGTTVAALTAACLCFMLQQWSVARQEPYADVATALEADRRAGILPNQR